MDVMKFDDGCGRYSLSTTSRELIKRYHLGEVQDEIPRNFDIKPGQTLPVVVRSADSQSQLEFMKWGLVPFWWKKDAKISFATFNARAESVFTSSMWRSIYKKRVLVPASGYFEWTKPAKKSGTPKQKYYFRPKQMDVFSFAGFYDVWHDAEGVQWKTYTIITTEPNIEARAIHDRMPVILHQEDEAAWLDPSRTKREGIEPFMHPFEDNGLEVYEVDSDAKAYEYNDEGRITPLRSL
jgi:putative SOS response-associated peptidase YedK